jgi:hypothetical protein
MPTVSFAKRISFSLAGKTLDPIKTVNVKSKEYFRLSVAT